VDSREETTRWGGVLSWWKGASGGEEVAGPGGHLGWEVLGRNEGER